MPNHRPTPSRSVPRSATAFTPWADGRASHVRELPETAYWCWLAITAIGILVPAAVVLQKLAITPDVIQKAAQFSPGSVHAVRRFTTSTTPVLAAVRWLMRRIAWVRPGGLGGMHYYVRDAIANSAILAALVAFRGRVTTLLERCIAFARAPGPSRRVRVLASAFLALTVVTWQLRLHWGPWFQGIAGWDFHDSEALLLPSPPDGMQATSLTPAVRSALAASLIARPSDVPPPGGYAIGAAVLLHFADGSVLPANDGIFGLVFPDVPFTAHVWNDETQRTVIRLAQHGVDLHSRDRVFLLPRSLSYPAHADWQHVDYTAARHKTIIGVSWWQLAARMQPGEPPAFAGASLVRLAGRMNP